MNKLIGTEGCSTPMGDAGSLRPRRNEEAQVTPHGKRTSCSGNQLTQTFLISTLKRFTFSLIDLDK